MDKPFVFKQFTVAQDQCAMKIGTDGVLLGAWAPLDHLPNSILDVGAGTGVISLMLAQRSDAQLIDALEIDDAAYEQCTENFENSPWGDRLFCYHASFQEFWEEMDESYDLIICNPPFYTQAFKTEDEQRNLARFEDALPFEHLVYGAARLLSEDGVFAMVLPYQSEENLITLAEQVGLHPKKITRVKGSPSSEVKRSLIAFSFEKQAYTEDQLIIETKRHQYTEAYIELTKAFYLKM